MEPLITDSGGFQVRIHTDMNVYGMCPPAQVFSLAHASASDTPELKRRSAERHNNEGVLLRVGERGCAFRSY